jgi:DNA-binding transcriptional ArsR family regulator
MVVKVALQIRMCKSCFRYAGVVAKRPEPDDPELLELTDPLAFRAVAHPARTLVIDELYGGARRTASELAKRTGLSASAMSYHLRALEKWGIVTRAEPADDRRERPWKRAAKRLSFKGSGASDTTSDAVTSLYLDQLRHDFADWRKQVRRESGEWAEAGNLSRGRAYLTAEELRGLDQLVLDAIDAIATARTPEDHPEGSRRVSFFWATAPLVEHEDD